jgi:hypothetical protein
MKDEDDWIELEYKHLRDEIMSLGAAKLGTVRFYLPAAASVYAVPYLLKQTGQAYLWALCSAVAGLLVLTMSQTLFVSSNGIRRLGVYIRDVLEPRTRGGLRWEHAVRLFDGRRRFWLGQSFTISASAVVANVVAASGAAFAFLPQDTSRLWPILAAAVTAVPTIPGLWRMLRPTAERDLLMQQIDSIIANQITFPTASSVQVGAEANNVERVTPRAG